MAIWTTPVFEQVKMDAEIGSYNEDTGPVREEPTGEECEAHAAG